MLTTGEMPEYLIERVCGVVVLLRHLMKDDCTDAITTGEERLTPGLLAWATIHLGSLDDLAPGTARSPTFRRRHRPPSPSHAAGADETRSWTTAVTGQPQVTDTTTSIGLRPVGRSPTRWKANP
ncbi:hypothetical protein PV729_09835 [Streptomyces europaeiscabiei]|uniref:Transposase n=1 Tax=Streptomyces europaeiscabiei TaxID=146819 RepID=A0ABU4NWR7_9ACTN|nr:hypothetical protein [Streptomyces europaeiscabiei]MDX3549820.1 hypothetical protein [Streptomyces europaeiscabiei]MDX3552067.1 hypothetical protein [Streptomyces europaeiscabiei]MDX3707040.1 hypothetical protein [Streptomyces europaeiscabiei]